MKCQRCGGCCRRYEIIPVEDTDNTPRELVEECHDSSPPLTPYLRMKIVDNHCIALGTDNLCTIYKRRPRVCREFQAEQRGCDAVRFRVAMARALGLADTAFLGGKS